MNGKTKVGLYAGIPVFIIAGWLVAFGTLKGEVKGDIEYIKEEVREVKETHEKDVEGINDKLATLVNLVQSQAIVQGKIQTDISYMRQAIQEIKVQ